MRQIVSRSITAALLVFALYWTVRLFIADQYARSDSLARLSTAARLAPGNTEFLLRLATADPWDNAQASEFLRRAVQASPLDAHIWTEISLRAEQNDPAKAEYCLLRAAALDKGFTPRWNLVSFYFRHGQQSKFFRWARDAMAISPDNQLPILQLCWKMSEDADLILRSAVPIRPDTLTQYLWYLISTKRMAAADQVVNRLLPIADRSAQPVLLYYCDLRINAGSVERAAEIWNSLCQRGIIQGEQTSASAYQSIGNGDFRFEPLSRGFDWLLSSIAGVTQQRELSPIGLRIQFSGKQPEFCQPLAHFVLLQPERRYRLAYTYTLDGIQPGSGLKWQLFVDALGNRDILPASTDDFSETGRSHSEIEVHVPPGFNSGRLMLTYQRLRGTTRVAGSITLSDTSLRLAP